MKAIIMIGLAGGLLVAQEQKQQDRTVLQPTERKPENRKLADGSYLLEAGSRVPLTVLNSVSSKQARPGDSIYLQTLVPVAVAGRIVIPVGTYVTGTITETKRPGRVKGKGEIAMRFDTLLFPSGTSLNLAGRIGSLDGDHEGSLDRDEGKVKSEGSVGKDAKVIAGTTVAGTAMGSWIGDGARAAGGGAAAGGLTGLAAVLLTRGPEAVLTKGSTVEMVLSTNLKLTEEDLVGTMAPKP